MRFSEKVSHETIDDAVGVKNPASQAHVAQGGPCLRLALLCDYNKNSAGTILDHIFGIRDMSRHDITVVNFRGELPASVDLDDFDGLIIHYSLVACFDTYISPITRILIRNFKGVKVVFIQDEYRFINDTVAALRAMRINALLSVVNEEVIDEIYPPHELPNVRRETVLTGYVPEHLLDRDVPAYGDRPIEIGYRGRKLPAWLGFFSQEKWIIAERVRNDAKKFGLITDISYDENDRIYGEKWLDFVSSCKSMIGVESGSSICDFTGEIQSNVEAHIANDPEATFEKLRDIYFKDIDGHLLINVISPRCFEAAALRTLMIMYPGTYSGRLVAGRHYVVLNRDHSNMDEVVSIIRDTHKAQEIIDLAYNEVALNPDNTFNSMVGFFDEVVDERHSTLGLPIESASNKQRKGKKKNKKAVRGTDIKSVRFSMFFNQQRSRVLHLIELTAPFLVYLLDSVLNHLAPEKAKKIRKKLQRIYRRVVKRDTSLLMGFNSINGIISLLGRTRRKVIMSLYGVRWCATHMGTMINVAGGLRLLEDLAGVATLADGLSVSLSFDERNNSLSVVLVEPNEDGQFEFEGAIDIDDLIECASARDVRIDDIKWVAHGCSGISRTLPFSGECEIEGLSAGLKENQVATLNMVKTGLARFT